VSALGADLGAIDALARLRVGRPLVLRGASAELCDLIRFCGLEGVLGVEREREPEEREDPSGVEEERQLGDPPVA
jgi:hypothetical protein